MPDQTPAELLRAAAAQLRDAATAAEADAPSPWHSQPRHDSDPTSTVSLWAAHSPLLHGAAGTRGRTSFVTGPVGRYMALLHPGVGAALADWLDTAADMADAYPEMAHDHDRPACDDYACDVMGRAVDLARQLLGVPS